MCLVFLVVTIAIWPLPYAFVVERFILPEYESTFGFRGGRLPVTTRDASHTIYALVAVVPDGMLGRAGATSGDIPLSIMVVFGRFMVRWRRRWPEGRATLTCSRIQTGLTGTSGVSSQSLQYTRRRRVRLFVERACRPTNEMKLTRQGQDGASPLISVLCIYEG